MRIATLAVVLSLAASASAALWWQGAARFTQPQPDSQEAAMARWMASCRNGPAHVRLAELVGKYETTTRMTMPGMEMPETKGTCDVTWLVEGRWLQADWTGSMMGTPTKGKWILGYDMFKQRYVMTMVDSFQTTMNSACGLFDRSGDDLILWGTIDEPMTPEQDKQVKYVLRGFGKDKWAFETHDMMIGETDTKVLELAFARRK